MVLDSDGGCGAVLDGEGDLAVDHVICGELADLVVVAYLSDGDGYGVEHKSGADPEEIGILKIRRLGSHVLIEQVGKGGEILEQEAYVKEAL